MAEYPERLLPHPDYCIIAGETLGSQKDLWLIRHIDSDKAQFIEGTKTLNPDCITIQSNHLRDLSNNLLGVFRVEDIYWGIKKEFIPFYCDAWDGEEVCQPPQTDQFFHDAERGFYFIPVDSLLSRDIEIYNSVTESTESYHFIVLHTPTKCNFWHISIRVYNAEDKEVSQLNIKDKQKHKIWKTVKDFLVTSIIQTEAPEEFHHIDNDLYLSSH